MDWLSLIWQQRKYFDEIPGDLLSACLDEIDQILDPTTGFPKFGTCTNAIRGMGFVLRRHPRRVSPALFINTQDRLDSIIPCKSVTQVEFELLWVEYILAFREGYYTVQQRVDMVMKECCCYSIRVAAKNEQFVQRLHRAINTMSTQQQHMLLKKWDCEWRPPKFVLGSLNIRIHDGTLYMPLPANDAEFKQSLLHLPLIL